MPTVHTHQYGNRDVPSRGGVPAAATARVHAPGESGRAGKIVPPAGTP